MKVSNQLFSNIQRLVSDGYVRKAKHPVFENLSIFVYTPKAEFEEIWDSMPDSRICRGLVIDTKTNEIIISCIHKFFNHDSRFAPNISFDNSEITLKEDGYLIQVVKTHDYGLLITTKGSFDNQYVDEAKLFIETMGIENHLEEDIVYVCELLKDFPDDEDIIVTRHGDITRLVCWSMVNRLTGEEIRLTENCPFETIRQFTPEEASEYLTQEVEGIVLHNWTTGERVKMKTEWFFKRHKLISNCTKTRVYEMLKNGERVQDLDIPDEFMRQMLEWQNEILGLIDKYDNNAHHYYELFKNMSDKEFAQLSGNAVPKRYVDLVFMLRKNRMYSFYSMIWKYVKEKVKNDNC